MNQQEVQQQGEQSQPKQGPGDVLQTARISVGLTLEEVARKMHLSIGILSSLEENKFEDITAPIFVKGYLRAYSRMVQVNEDEIIEQYSQFYMDGDPPITSTSNTSSEINANDSTVKWVTYLIIIGLIVLLSTWWWNRYQQEPEKMSLESESQTPTEVIASDSASESSTAAIDSVALDAEKDFLQQEIKTAVDSIQSPTQDINTVSSAAESLAVTAAEQSEPVVVEPETVVEEASAAIPEAVTQGEVTTDANPSQQIPLESDQNLVITVNADTWASIKDATGKKLVYRLLVTGETISVTGSAPFRAFLGNGYGVNMKYKGKDIDLSSVIQADNTARIKIGQ